MMKDPNSSITYDRQNADNRIMQSVNPMFAIAVLFFVFLAGAAFGQDFDRTAIQPDESITGESNLEDFPQGELTQDEFLPGESIVQARERIPGNEVTIQPEIMGQANPNGPGVYGFADTAWKTSFSDVKGKMKNLATAAVSTERVEILQEERNKMILVRRNDVLYRYSFYKTPYNVAKLQNHELSEEEYDNQEALLYHVKVTMPFIESIRIKDKLKGLFGSPTKSTVDKKMMGADIYDLPGGFVFQWYEPYQKVAYTRTLDYLSSDMAKLIMTEYADYFDAHEKYILQFILLK